MTDDTVKLPVTLKDGTVLTDDRRDEFVEEAEAGYDPASLRLVPGRAGHPPLGTEGVSPRIQFRAPAGVYELARARAARQGRTVSAVMRELLVDYASGGPHQGARRDCPATPRLHADAQLAGHPRHRSVALTSALDGLRDHPDCARSRNSAGYREANYQPDEGHPCLRSNHSSSSPCGTSSQRCCHRRGQPTHWSAIGRGSMTVSSSTN